jgi:predicted transcriptional regulator
MFKAKDIMTTHVVAVKVDDTIDEVISLMVKHRISGLPVVDEQGRPVGVISEFDLLNLICEGQTIQAHVRRYMSGNLYSVTEEDSWVHVVDLFRATYVRRLPVLREGRLVGIVTRHDLMHAIHDARQQIREKLAQRAHEDPGQPQPENVRTMPAEEPA